MKWKIENSNAYAHTVLARIDLQRFDNVFDTLMNV